MGSLNYKKGECDKVSEFEKLSFALLDRLYSIALSMTRNRHDAEDLVQTTYMKAWRYFHWFKPGSNFDAWIFRILTNLYINDYRRKKRGLIQFNLDFAESQFENNATCDEMDPAVFDQDFDFDTLFDDEISDAFKTLPEKYRLVILLADVDNQKYRDIAEMLKVPIGTVMSRLSRGRKILSGILKGYAVENGFIVG